MFRCKSKKHFWTMHEDAKKCCNGYTRILVLGGGTNQQLAAGIACGRAWVRVEALSPRGMIGADPKCANCGGHGGAQADGSCGECWGGIDEENE